MNQQPTPPTPEQIQNLVMRQQRTIEILSEQVASLSAAQAAHVALIEDMERVITSLQQQPAEEPEDTSDASTE